MNGYADDLAAVIEALDLTGVTLVGHSTGGGEVARYIGRHGTKRVAKAVLIAAVPPIMLKSPANPEGLPMEVFDGNILTPNDRFFVRWHWGDIPTSIDTAAFRLKVHGAVERPLALQLDERRGDPGLRVGVRGELGGQRGDVGGHARSPPSCVTYVYTVRVGRGPARAGWPARRSRRHRRPGRCRRCRPRRSASRSRWWP